MDLAIKNRLEKIKQVKENYNLTFQQIAEASELHRDAVQHAIGGRKYYVTENNLSVIEKGITKILNEYKEQLCGKDTFF